MSHENLKLKKNKSNQISESIVLKNEIFEYIGIFCSNNTNFGLQLYLIQLL